MRAAVVYESMFGNTARIAQAVADGLRNSGAQVELLPVTVVGDDVLDCYDLVVMGAPTHGLGLSRPGTRADAVLRGAPAEVEDRGVREWLEELHDARPGSVQVAAFDTRALSMRRWPGSAARHIAHLLRRRGYEVPPATSFYVTGSGLPLAGDEESRAACWARSLGRRTRQPAA